MRSRLHNLPSVGAKVIWIVALISAAAVIAVSIASGVRGYLNLRQQRVEAVTAHALIVAVNSSAPLSFGDDEMAGEALAALRVVEGVQHAVLLDREGRVFARFAADGQPAQDGPLFAEGHWSTDAGYALVVPVTDPAGTHGRLQVNYSGSRLAQEALAVALQSLLLSLAAIGLAWLLASRIHPLLTAPITELETVTRRVRDTGDYSVRARRISADELGRLTDHFNEMLEQIESSQQALVEAQRLAEESEARFRMLADNIPQLAWIADAGTDGQVRWFNKSWLDYTGTTIEEMKGSGWQSVHHPDHADRVIQKFQHHVRQSLDWEDTFPLRGKDGQFRWFLSRMKVIREESGQVVRIFGTNTDITEARGTAEDLRRLTAELSEAARRKDEFLATLAHELRNPLAPIRNGLQVMRLAGVHGTIEQARAMMDRQLTHLVRLVDDLLDVSRVTSGKLELRRARVEIRAVVDAALETSRPVIEQAGHALTVVVPDEAIFVDGDATRLAQVLANLLNNAAKYTHRGGQVSLSVSHENGMAVLVVSDDGIGIPAGMLDKVFEMFTQVDRALEKTTGGLGIGLSLAKGLVEMQGGTIEAQSEGDGRGSTFTVRLPISYPALQIEPPVGEAPLRRASRRILVADDNLDAAESLAQLLTLLGNEVRTANDGLHALDAAESFRPEVILLDIGMPKLNGYETCRRIRERPWGKNARLVALTGWGQDGDKRRSQEAGFDHHLIKPVDLRTLEKLLAG